LSKASQAKTNEDQFRCSHVISSFRVFDLSPASSSGQLIRVRAKQFVPGR
jgi:hypothetical protein